MFRKIKIVSAALAVGLSTSLPMATVAVAPVAAQDSVLLAAAAPATAEDCFGSGGMTAPDRRVLACTDAIEAGQLEASSLARARLNRGAAYVVMNDRPRAAIDYMEALAYYEKTIDPHKPDASTLFYRASAYLALGKPDQALVDYGNSLRLQPSNVVALVDRGALLARRGNAAAAIADFDKALEIQPTNFDALIFRGDARTRLGQPDAALTDLDRAIEIAPGIAHAHVVRGLANARRGDNVRATVDYVAALAIDPHNVDALVNRAAILATGGKFELASADLDAALELRPENAVALYNRAYIHFARKEYDRAIADYSEAIRVEPTLAEAYTNRCLTRAIVGQDDLDAALSDCAIALAIKPNDLDARETRAFVFLKQEQAGLAMAEYDAVLKVAPKRAIALYGRGLARTKMGDRENGNADRAAARTLSRGIDRQFTAYGLN